LGLVLLWGASAVCRDARADDFNFGSIFDEVKIGFLAADTGIGGPKIETGLDINGELLFSAPQWFVSPDDPWWKRFLFAPRPDVGFTINTAGGTDFVYGALNWSADIAHQILDDHDSIYGSFEFGGGWNNSDLNPNDTNNKDMGSRAVFRLAVEIGYNIDEHANVSLYYEHFSNAGLGTTNPGMNDLGLRLGYRF